MNEPTEKRKEDKRTMNVRKRILNIKLLWFVTMVC